MSCRPFVLCSLSLFAACTVGDVRDLDPQVGVDAAAGDPDPDPGPDAAPVECRDAVPSAGNGEHNPGQACIACHAGGEGPTFTLAGTLYADAAGTTPLAGATIVVTDATGATFDLVTHDNGNFWTNQAVTFPVRVAASRCPDTVPMVSAINAGDCNVGGCHAAGAPSGRIHLP